MKIISLQASNVKRLRAVEIRPDPDGSLVVIGGRNEQGKSSVLDSIMYALAGKDSMPAKPLRNGEKKGHVRVDLGEFIVERTFTEAGGKLTVKSKDGAVYPSPQAMLDALCGRLSFDPMEFSRLKSAQQLTTLQQLVGLDFTEADQRKKDLYDDRTHVNREVNSLKARLDAAPRFDDVPTEEVSISDLMRELERRQLVNRAKWNKGQEAAHSEHEIGQATSLVRATMTTIEDLERKLKAAKGQLERDEAAKQAAIDKADRLKAEAAAMPEEECDSVHQQINSADSTNRKVRANAERAKLAQDLEKREAEAAELTEKINGVECLKSQQMAAAAFPVEGLAFDDSGVTFRGVPLEQCSQEERLRISVGIGLAMNPKLPIVLMREGAFLDADHLALVGQMAAEKGAQIWVERVGEGDECQIVIEDGTVKEVEAPEPALA